MIPERLKTEIEKKLDLEITSTKPQSGGDINQAAIISFEDGTTSFLKYNFRAPNGMFEAETKGLELLSDAGTELVIPEVILIEKDFLLLSLIESGTRNSDSAYNFGIELARLHQHTSDQFGLNHDNFIGRLPQSNSQKKSWADFFISERIEPQIKLGVDSRKFPSDTLIKSDKLHSVVENLFPTEKPSLLHGDLWSGNYMYTANGITSIYDPAVYYGHREMDIAMTRLFGGFSKDFYAGYQSEYPLEDGFEERVQLCNLCPVLVHANLFGGGYVRQAESILAKFCG